MTFELKGDLFPPWLSKIYRPPEVPLEYEYSESVQALAWCLSLPLSTLGSAEVYPVHATSLSSLFSHQLGWAPNFSSLCPCTHGIVLVWLVLLKTTWARWGFLLTGGSQRLWPSRELPANPWLTRAPVFYVWAGSDSSLALGQLAAFLGWQGTLGPGRLCCPALKVVALGSGWPMWQALLAKPGYFWTETVKKV